jgi:Na+/H+ antiporter NhaD/arsenite permease-like protein
MQHRKGRFDMQIPISRCLVLLPLLLLCLTSPVLAMQGTASSLSVAGWVGTFGLVVFGLAYMLVIAEERLHLRKSKPMLVAAGLMWIGLGIGAAQVGQSALVEHAFRHYLVEFAELFLFLLAAMTYVNTLEERGVFLRLRASLINARFSYRGLFWALGAFAFCSSPFLDNLTAALITGAVALTLGAGQGRFVSISCISIVVAANAGGAFTPFGDITTLMVWQAGHASFMDFLRLFVPSLINWLVPALCMLPAIPKGYPEDLRDNVPLKAGAWVVMALFAVTIVLAVIAHSLLGLPPVLGMLTGLGLLKLYAYFLTRGDEKMGLSLNEPDDVFASSATQGPRAFDPFKQLERAEWDTLMFFYGVIMAVGALGTLGYLQVMADGLYGKLGATTANVLVGLISAVLDNIPVMVAVLGMRPEMPLGEWLLVTLTAGVGGSLLSVGSAAGVALMGQARGVYTFMAHLQWTWAIALGYVAAIAAHLWLNATLF